MKRIMLFAAIVAVLLSTTGCTRHYKLEHKLKAMEKAPAATKFEDAKKQYAEVRDFARWIEEKEKFPDLAKRARALQVKRGGEVLKLGGSKLFGGLWPLGGISFEKLDLALAKFGQALDPKTHLDPAMQKHMGTTAVDPTSDNLADWK